MKTNLAPCPLCGSDHITTLSGRSFTTGCRDCFQVKVQCFPTPEESEAAWNKLFDHFPDVGKMPVEQKIKDL